MSLIDKSRQWIAGQLLGKSVLEDIGRTHQDDGYIDLWSTQQEPDANALIESYRGTAYACANLCAQGVAATPLRLYVTTGKGQERAKCGTRPLDSRRVKHLEGKAHLAHKLAGADDAEEVTDHPILTLLDQVNSELDGFTLMEFTDLYQEVVGTAYWQFDYTLGIMTAIWVLQSQYVTPIFVKGKLVKYEYGTGQHKQDIPADQVLAFHMPSLVNPYYDGLSPLRAAYESVHLQEQEAAQGQALLNNMARPDLVVTPKTDYGTVGEVAQRRLRNRFKREFRRGKAGGIAILDGQYDIKPITFSPKDLQMATLHHLTKEDISNAYGVPMSLLQTKDVNRANAQAGHYQLAKNAILPRCRRMEQRLTQRFCARFDERLFVAFDDPVPENRELVMAERKQNLDTGVLCINEVRAEEGMEPTEGGDVHLVDGTKKPLDLVINPPEPVPMTAPAPGKDEKPKDDAKFAKRLVIYDALVRGLTDSRDIPDAIETLIQCGVESRRALEMLTKHKLDAPEWFLKMRRNIPPRPLPDYAPMRDALQRIFEEQRKETLRHFKGYVAAWTKEVFYVPADAGAVFDAGVWTERMTPKLSPFFGIAMREGVQQAKDRLGDVPVVNMQLPEVRTAIESATMEFCAATNATTSMQLDLALGKLRDDLAAGIIDQEYTLQSLTKSVSGVFDQAEAYRAERIARTETSRGIHEGQRAEAKVSGIVRGFRPMVAADACPICQQILADYPEISLDGDFGTRGTGDYAVLNSPPFHPNCVCTLEEVLIDEPLRAEDE